MNGQVVSTKFCHACGKELDFRAELCPHCGVRQPGRAAAGSSGVTKRTTAAIFAILLGAFGIHKFYLGKPGQGILYLLFFWTFIPGVVGFIEGIVYLTMSDDEFMAKYQ